MIPVATIGAVVSSSAAAVAAGLSWRSNVHTRKLAEESRLPHLHAQVVQFNNRHAISIHNGGTGVARGVFFLVVGDGELCTGVVPWPSGFLKGGHEITTEMMFKNPLPRISQGVVACRDYRGFPRYWILSSDGPPRVYKKFSWRQRGIVPDVDGTLQSRAQELLEQAPDLGALTRVDFGLTDASKDPWFRADFRDMGGESRSPHLLDADQP